MSAANDDDDQQQQHFARSAPVSIPASRTEEPAPAGNSKWWCHECAAEIAPLMPDCVCPNCRCEFIEQVDPSDPDDDPRLFASPPQPDRAAPAPSPTLRATVLSTFRNLSPLLATSPTRISVISPSGLASSPVAATFQVIPLVSPATAHPASPLSLSSMLRGLLSSAAYGGDLAGDGDPRELNDVLDRLFLQAQAAAKKPVAAKAVVEALPRIRIEEQAVLHSDKWQRFECTVCQDPAAVGDTLIELPCNHHYHSDCILEWLKRDHTCPTCRFALQTEEPSSGPPPPAAHPPHPHPSPATNTPSSSPTPPSPPPPPPDYFS